MSRAVLLHGKYDEAEYFDPAVPSASNRQWLPWLQNRLLIAGHDVQAPEIHRSFEPDYEVWRAGFEPAVTAGSLILVGHSCGAGFLLRWLSERPDRHVEKLVLVAPWLDPGRRSTTDFFDFELDRELPARVGELHIFWSTDDEESIGETAAILLAAFPEVFWHSYGDRGHFTTDSMGTDEFPELLAAVLG